MAGIQRKTLVDWVLNMHKLTQNILETSALKRSQNLEFKLKSLALGAELTGKKPEKYSKRLTKVMDYRNKLLATESYESDKQLLDHHVTTAEPTVSNVNKMHDMVRNIAKTHGVSSRSEEHTSELQSH